MNALPLISNILLSILFIGFGIGHLRMGEAMAGMVPSFIPGGVIWVYVTGISMILGAIGLYIKAYRKWALLGLSALLALFILTIHLPGVIKEGMNGMSFMGFLKDSGILAGLLFMVSKQEA